MTKRKAEDDSVDGVETDTSRKRLDTSTKEHLGGIFHDRLFSPEVLSLATKTYAESKPYKHGIINDLVSPELLRNVRSEIQEHLSFTPKETDIYKIHQSGDLANLDGLSDSSLELLPSLLKLRDALYSKPFREHLSTITGAGALSGSKTDMAINVYTPGCHLLCHDDVIGSRRVSYILYLTDPDTPWKAEWGGALRLYPTLAQTSEDGKVHKIPSPDHEVSIPPSFNQLSFFAVQPGQSFHDVEEVYACQGEDEKRIRTAISGWYHIPQEGEEGFAKGEENLTDNSSLRQLESKPDEFDLPKTSFQTPIVGNDSSFSSNDDRKPTALPSQQDELLSENDLNFLLKYISPTYLTPDTLESVSKVFTGQWSLTLDSFLTNQFSESLKNFISIQESQALPVASPDIEMATPWTVARPPHKHRFLYQQMRETRPTDPRSQSPLQDLLENLFPSLHFYKWLRLATGHTVTSHNLIARRFRRGKDYTLATGYEDEESRLEITLGVTPSSGWEPDLELEEDADNKVVAGEKEEEEADNKVVAGEKEEEEAGNEVVAVEKEEEEADNKVVAGEKEEEEAKNEVVAGEKEEEAKNEVVAGEKEEEEASNEVVAGEKEVEELAVVAADVQPTADPEESAVSRPIDERQVSIPEERAEEVGDVGKRTEVAEISDDAPSGNVGGYLAYMAGDDDADDGSPDEAAGEHSKGPKKSTLDPAVYQTSGQGDDSVLFSMPAGWNKLAIVLRDQGVFRFVKYVSEQAKGDRWDVLGEYSVVNQDVEEEGDEVRTGNEVQTTADQINYSDETTEHEEETSSDDD
ncbi:hypothetical protein MMC29_005859 [Sticta canariensis]|nr:hypothetical protein [Sticta canariensis]